MKDKEKTKPTKKKIVTYYLILAACLLVIAGITVGIVFAVQDGGGVTPPVIDSGDKNNGDDNSDDKKDPENPANPDDGNKPDDKEPDGGKDDPSAGTSSQYEFIVPVNDVNLAKAFVFSHDKTLNRYCVHQGMDFACAEGTEVLAAVDGTVKSVTTEDRLYGGVITVEHSDGVTTVYRYVNPDENLKEGAKIARGEKIGTVMKATGAEIEDGDHLHFEVYKNNIMQDPDDYLNIISK